MVLTRHKILHTYVNGNYFVRIYDDGTKVRMGEGDFEPLFPENIDVKITSHCDGGCPMCHENSTPDGRHGDLSLPFFDTLAAGTELAIGGGNPLEHPDLVPFLRRMKAQGVVCNITVRQTHLFANKDFVQSLIDDKLVWGVGISFVEASDELLDFVRRNKNCVIHLIAGVHGVDVLEQLADKDLKILWLGYKRFGRGEKYYSADVQRKIDELKAVFYDNVDRFAVVSLDNAATELFAVKENISRADFARYYMGDEGTFTMYVDAVDRQFAVNSVTPVKQRQPLHDNIRTMFGALRGGKIK